MKKQPKQATAAQLEAIMQTQAASLLLATIKAKAERHAAHNPQPRALFLLG